MKKNYALLFALLFIGQVSFAQQTGLFSGSMSFSSPAVPGQTRTLWYNVPSDYSASKKYKLIVGFHGSGSSPQNYCQAPFTGGELGNVIHVCPNTGSAPEDSFCDPAGEDEGLVDAIIAKVAQAYNVDEDYVVLSGFSRGGRCSLQIGLENAKKYRGMMLFAPAISTMQDAQNTTLYKYADAKYIPLCMVTGENDTYGYNTTNAEVENQYTIHGGDVSYTQMSGVGHAVPTSMSYFTTCMDFIETHPGGAGGISVKENETGINSINLFPNPNKGIFTFSATLQSYDDAELKVFDVLGKEVDVFNTGFIGGKAGINMIDQPDGVYFVRLKTEDFSKTLRLVLQR